MGQVHYVNRNVFANAWSSKRLEIMFVVFLFCFFVDINT